MCRDRGRAGADRTKPARIRSSRTASSPRNGGTWASNPEWFAEHSRPRLLYVGSLDDRVDVEQVAKVARAYPDGSVVLVGPLRDGADFAALTEHPNVVIRGWLGTLAGCHPPHRRGRRMPHPTCRQPADRGHEPLKLYECLAGDRPVAAVDLPPIAAVEGQLALAPADGELAPAVAQPLALSVRPPGPSGSNS
jgi:teichuronic acid biosynthesis glycosyltransferase TuaH